MLRPNTANTPAIFHFVMIKPSHYDDDGYPIQWLRSAIPSNTLACLNALAEDAKRRQIVQVIVERCQLAVPGIAQHLIEPAFLGFAGEE